MQSMRDEARTYCIHEAWCRESVRSCATASASRILSTHSSELIHRSAFPSRREVCGRRPGLALNSCGFCRFITKVVDAKKMHLGAVTSTG